MRLGSKRKPRTLRKKASVISEPSPTQRLVIEGSINQINVYPHRTPTQRGRDLNPTSHSSKFSNKIKSQLPNPQNPAKRNSATPNCQSSTPRVRPRAFSDNNCMNMKYGILTSERYTKLVMSNKRIRPIFLDSVYYNAC